MKLIILDWYGYYVAASFLSPSSVCGQRCLFMDFGAFRFLGLSEQGLGSAKEERTLSIVTIGITIPFGNINLVFHIYF